MEEFSLEHNILDVADNRLDFIIEQKNKGKEFFEKSDFVNAYNHYHDAFTILGNKQGKTPSEWDLFWEITELFADCCFKLDKHDFAIAFYSNILEKSKVRIAPQDLPKALRRVARVSAKIAEIYGKEQPELRLKVLKEAVQAFERLMFVDDEDKRNLAYWYTEIAVALSNKSPQDLECRSLYKKAISALKAISNPKPDDFRQILKGYEFLGVASSPGSKNSKPDYLESINQFKLAIQEGFNKISEPQKQDLLDFIRIKELQIKVFVADKNLKSAISCYEQIVDIFKENPSLNEERRSQANYLKELGFLYDQKMNYLCARKSLLQALSYYLKEGNNEDKKQIGEIYAKLSNFSYGIVRDFFIIAYKLFNLQKINKINEFFMICDSVYAESTPTHPHHLLVPLVEFMENIERFSSLINNNFVKTIKGPFGDTFRSNLDHLKKLLPPEVRADLQKDSISQNNETSANDNSANNINTHSNKEPVSPAQLIITVKGFEADPPVQTSPRSPKRQRTGELLTQEHVVSLVEENKLSSSRSFSDL